MRTEGTVFRPRLFGVPQGTDARLNFRATDCAWRLIWEIETLDQPVEFMFVPDLLTHVVFDLRGTIEVEPFVIRSLLSPVRLACPPHSHLLGVCFFLWDSTDWFHFENEGLGTYGWPRKNLTGTDLVYFFLLSRARPGTTEHRAADRYLSWFEDEMNRLNTEHAGIFRHLGKPTEMALASGYSDRQLRRLQRRHAGIGPKDIDRIARFQQQLAQLQDNGRLDILTYSDQAHAIREFREFSSMTPGHYLKHYYLDRNLQSGTGA